MTCNFAALAVFLSGKEDQIMSRLSLGVLMALLLAGQPAVSQAKGCLKGAAVGGVVGHVAGHHAVAGAALGCLIGHHRAKVRDRAPAGNANNGAAGG